MPSCIAEGKANRDVGDIVDIRPRTLHMRLEHVFETPGIRTRAGAARWLAVKWAERPHPAGRALTVGCDTMRAMTHPRISLIAAVARNAGIGRDNALLWSEPEDQRHFRRVTLGHPVIMGRRTWESLPARFRPLPGRRNFVVTRQPQWQAVGAEAVPSLEAALDRLAGQEQAFVIGGAQLYATALPLASELVLTEVEADWPADAFFPAFDRSAWDIQASAPQVGSTGQTYRFVTYRKTGGT